MRLFNFKHLIQMVANTGIIPSMFAEQGIQSYGTLTTALREPPQRSIERQRAEDTIRKLAKAQGIGVGQMIHKVLSQSIPELNAYVQAQGESPSSDVKKLAVQAAMLRAAEIGSISKALDVSDYDALSILEESEEEHIEDNDAEASFILSPDTAGAVCLLVYRLSDRYKERGGDGRLKSLIVATKNASGAGDFDNMSMGALVNNATGGGGIFYTPEQEQEVTGGVTSTDPEKSSWWDNLFASIDKVVDGITKVSGAVSTTVGNVKNTSGTILDQINQIGGGIGASSIDQYLKANWMKVVGILVVLIIFTILILRVGRK